MRPSIDRRAFLRRTGAVAAALLGGPLAITSRARAAGDRLVVAVGQWGIETPFAWRSSQSEKTLWDTIYDPLITRDPKTFAYRPGLATEWKPSNELKTWTFKLRSGVMFHEGYGEMTAEDVKFTVEQNLKPDVPGGSAPFFRSQLDRIETPDKHTVVMHFKNRVWEVPTHFTQFVGYQNITSKKYLESVGEEKASLHPIGTGPYRHVEGRQGDYHRFEAVPKHWRKTPAFKELVIRRIPEPATRLAGLRAGEIDIGQVFSDYLEQARKAGLRIHETPKAACYWVVLHGQTTQDREDYCPTCPWAGEPGNPKSLENARKVRMALSLAVDKKAIINGLWRGTGSETPFMYWYYPFNKGYSTEWKIPPYDPERAKKLLAEAGHAGGFEMRVNPMIFTYALDGNDVMEAVALDWEKLGIKVRRVPEMFANFLPKNRARKTNKTHWVYASPPFDEPSLGWQRTIWTKGAFNLLAEGPFDEDLNTILREVDADKRGKLTHDLAQKLYDGFYGVQLGVKSTTWAVSKKVSAWQTLVYVPLENNYEYVS
ncbi:MAG TPA: ABC transporter substrate-binding protein, partial [Methylomirabilota bacterium]|jgi:peptide/nickel transport system substrate-binding protein